MMIDNEVQDGKHYVYKNGTYVVIQCDNIETKDSNDSNWYPAVIYQLVGEVQNPGRSYVRRLDDFQAKFRPA